jgi:hypothetical protein
VADNIAVTTSDVAHVTDQMRAFTKPFYAPISYEPDDNTVRLSGTGNFVELFDRKLLLTCGHTVLGKRKLAFRLPGTEDYRAAPLKFASVEPPWDAAVSRLGSAFWSGVKHEAQAVRDNQFEPMHSADRRELLFFKGYAGENAKFAFDTLKTDGTAYLTQAVEIAATPRENRLFFFLSHRPEKTTFMDFKVLFENPAGFSGALVWNTGYIEAQMRGQPWRPEMAKVVGMVCRWVTGDPGIKVLRVEHLRSWLLSALGAMYADNEW